MNIMDIGIIILIDSFVRIYKEFYRHKYAHSRVKL